ncbi:MAG: hypothetical protein U5K54_06075 [Cytophagales bacterium]|nr:hypothetical protein [Cytophagales bacterium]
MGLSVNRTAHVRLFNDSKPNEHQPVDRAPAFKDTYNFVQSINESVAGNVFTIVGAIPTSVKK